MAEKKMVEEKRTTVEAVQDFEFAEDGHTIYTKKKGDIFGVYESFSKRLIENKQVKKSDTKEEYDIAGKVIKGDVAENGDNKSE